LSKTASEISKESINQIGKVNKGLSFSEIRNDCALGLLLIEFNFENSTLDNGDKLFKSTGTDFDKVNFLY
jgi:hypothetical protein